MIQLTPEQINHIVNKIAVQVDPDIKLTGRAEYLMKLPAREALHFSVSHRGPWALDTRVLWGVEFGVVFRYKALHMYSFLSKRQYRLRVDQSVRYLLGVFEYCQEHWEEFDPTGVENCRMFYYPEDPRAPLGRGGVIRRLGRQISDTIHRRVF